jgi:hypothetical protein
MIYVICASGSRSYRAGQFLMQMGYTHVANVRGGTAAWRRAGKPLSFGDTSAEQPEVIETEWAHGGGYIKTV